MKQIANSMFKADVAIIGAGPVGLFAVFELGMLGIKSVVFDALDHIGGQCTALYPEKPIYDIPAFSKIYAQDLVNKLGEQAGRFEPQYLLGSRVSKVSRLSGGGFEVLNEKEEGVQCKAIIIAAGCGAFGPNRPPILNIEKYEGTSVFYSVINKQRFENKRIVIAGGGDSAVDWANSLAEKAAKIFVVHRRDKFRAFEASLKILNKHISQGKVELVIPYQLSAIDGDDKLIRSIEVTDLEGNKRVLEADYLLPFFGLKAELGPIASWGLNIDKHHIQVAQHSLETNVPGIFAIGDIAYYQGKLKLILCGFSEAAMAAHSAYQYVFPGKALHFEYSTTKGL